MRWLVVVWSVFALLICAYYSIHIADFCILQVKAIRKKMVEIISREVTSNDMKEVVNKL